MKKVGIITIQKPPENYGASLQAYALWRYVDNLGFDCEIIDLLRPWHPLYKLTSKDASYKKSIKQRLIRLLVGKKLGYKMLNSSRYREFDRFNSICKYSKCYRSIDELYKDVPLYDYYISGSDQIWNPNMNIENEPYFLTFAPLGAQKISYASSFAIQSLPEDISMKFGGWLKSYHSISVREETGVKIINNMKIGKNAEVVLDPTFLLTKNDWIELFEGIGDKKNYIFVYLLHSNDYIYKYIGEISRKMGLKVYLVISDTSAQVPNSFETLMDIGPIHWIEYIKNAQFVITDSFHCTVFSLLFERRFQTIISNKMVSSRLQNLLLKLGASDCLINVDDFDKDYDIFPKLDYEIINKSIEKERNKSIVFLNKALNL